MFQLGLIIGGAPRRSRRHHRRGLGMPREPKHPTEGAAQWNSVSSEQRMLQDAVLYPE